MAKINPKPWFAWLVPNHKEYLIQKAVSPHPDYMPKAVPGPAYDNMMRLMIITSQQNAWHINNKTILKENPLNLN